MIGSTNLNCQPLSPIFGATQVTSPEYLYDLEDTYLNLIQNNHSTVSSKLESQYSLADLFRCAQQIKNGELTHVHTPQKEACFLVAMNIFLYCKWGNPALEEGVAGLVPHLINTLGEKSFVHCFKILSMIHAIGFRSKDQMSDTTTPYSNFKVYDNSFLPIAHEVLGLNESLSKELYVDLHYGKNNDPDQHWHVAPNMFGDIDPIWGEVKMLKMLKSNYPEIFEELNSFFLKITNASQPVCEGLREGFYGNRIIDPDLTPFKKGSFNIIFNIDKHIRIRGDYNARAWDRIAKAFEVMMSSGNPQLLAQCDQLQQIFKGCIEDSI
ncbi:MAG: hypothetical protein H0U49_11090 [Parachlamydiaceae bacterium]|nr:hypothetical protein [Parachlamydiaceae bacterium]